MEIFLLIWLLIGGICAAMAKSRGRNPVLGAILGLLFGIFAILGYWIAGETEDKKMERIARVMNASK